MKAELLARLEHADKHIRVDEDLPDWEPTRWVNAITAKLGMAAVFADDFLVESASQFPQRPPQVPGSAGYALEQFHHAMAAIACVALHAIEATEGKGA